MIDYPELTDDEITAPPEPDEENVSNTQVSDGDGDDAPPHSDDDYPGDDAPVDDGSHLPDEVWTSRPWLTHIRQAAWHRDVSPDALLLICLARCAVLVPHHIVVPPIIGSAVPLSLYAAVIGVPGAGKSAAEAVAAELLPGDDRLLELPQGSGEGLVDALFRYVTETDAQGKQAKVKRQLYHRAFVSIDEGEALMKLANARTGATVNETLRSIWSGRRLGAANATEERRRDVPPGQAAYGLVVGFQPDKIAPLFDDAAGGTPQRFLFATAMLADSDDDSGVDWPGRLERTTITPSDEDAHRHEIGWHRRTVLTFPADIDAADRAHSRALRRGQISENPLDAHRGLMIRKVAGIVATIEGRLDVTAADHDLATKIVNTSRRVRTVAVEHVAAERRQRDVRSNERAASREITKVRAVEADTEDDVARRVWELLDEAGDAGLSPSRIGRALSKSKRDHLGPVLRSGIGHNWWTFHENETTPGGSPRQRYTVGPSKPV